MTRPVTNLMTRCIAHSLVGWLALPSLCLTSVLFLGLSPGLTTPSLRAQDVGVSSLRGLGAVFVLVEDLPDGTRMRGLSRSTIQSEVEQRLRLAGLRVVTAEESARLPGAPYIYVRVNLADRARAASVDVELSQGALLTRNGEIVPSTITWRRSTLLSKPTAQNIRDAVNDRVDTFLNAWLSANPKRS